MQGAGGVGGLLAVTQTPVTGAPVTYYPCFDGNGNITEYINASGAIVAHYGYDPFGNTPIISGAQAQEFKYRFSTKRLENTTGLYYYGYRYYHPQTGRWINRDPIEERGGLNLYGFVGNKAVISWDVLGLDGPTLPVVNELVNYIAGTASEPGRLGDFLSSGSSRNFVDRPTTDLSNHPGVRSAIAVEQLRASAKRLAIQACCKKPGSIAAPIEVPNLGLAAVDRFVYPELDPKNQATG
jgi:RHS repeat-associated protein